MECEKDNKIAFLDVLINKENNGLITNVYKKSTFTGLLTNYSSFTSELFKIVLIKSLIDRAYKINNTWIGFHNDIIFNVNILKRNCFPQYIIDKVINKYLKSKFEKVSTQPSNKNVSYFKLPYIGALSKNFQKQLDKINQKYCENVDLRMVFQSCKISSFLSAKDRLNLQSHLVYQFNCAGCESAYVGFTTRHYQVRIVEHLQTDRTSHVNKHLNSDKNCKAKSNKDCFKILDKATTKYDLRIKEALHIKWVAPTINKQKQSLKLTLVL